MSRKNPAPDTSRGQAPVSHLCEAFARSRRLDRCFIRNDPGTTGTRH
jgi:hypothetical protein